MEESKNFEKNNVHLVSLAPKQASASAETCLLLCCVSNRQLIVKLFLSKYGRHFYFSKGIYSAPPSPHKSELIPLAPTLNHGCSLSILSMFTHLISPL